MPATAPVFYGLPSADGRSAPRRPTCSLYLVGDIDDVSVWEPGAAGLRPGADLPRPARRPLIRCTPAPRALRGPRRRAPLRCRRPRRRGGVATQRPAKPCTPVRFRSAPLPNRPQIRAFRLPGRFDGSRTCPQRVPRTPPRASLRPPRRACGAGSGRWSSSADGPCSPAACSGPTPGCRGCQSSGAASGRRSAAARPPRALDRSGAAASRSTSGRRPRCRRRGRGRW